MGRCLFPRGSRGLAVTLSVLSALSLSCVVVPTGTTSYAAAGVATTSSDIEAASTLDLTGLQAQFSQVCDRVSPSVVAISAACTAMDSDDALQTASLNPHKLDSMLSKTTRT